jgi:hypothetical protein
VRRENIPAVAHHLREYIAMNGTIEVPERIFQVAAVKGNDVIIPNTTICARDHQHALVKAAALVSAVKDEDAGASDIRYCVSEIQSTQQGNNGGGY